MAAFRLKVATAKLVGFASRLSGRGGGTSLPGKALLRLDQKAANRLAARLEDGSAVISATNGKTTTTTIARTIIELSGAEVVSNSAGANMLGGVTSALLLASHRNSIEGSFGLFEVDEFWLGQVLDALEPGAVLLANLFRDQLDRYGELESIGERWEQSINNLSDSSRVVLNADDPLVAALGEHHSGSCYFGIEDPDAGSSKLEHASDSTNCRVCGHPYEYEVVYLGHLGHYRCTNCGAERPKPLVSASSIELSGISGSRFTLTTPDGSFPVALKLPGLYNVYNALAAAALCHTLGISGDTIRQGIESSEAAFGRSEVLAIDGTQLAILLIKNPAGANEVVRTLADEPSPLTLFAVLNDRIADGRDISWIWDVDFEKIGGAIGSIVCSGTRAQELALRFKYAGVDRSKIITEPILEQGFDRAIASADGTLYALPTYTSLLELQQLLTKRGFAPNYWEKAQ